MFARGTIRFKLERMLSNELNESSSSMSVGGFRSSPGVVRRRQWIDSEEEDESYPLSGNSFFVRLSVFGCRAAYRVPTTRVMHFRALDRHFSLRRRSGDWVRVGGYRART